MMLPAWNSLKLLVELVQIRLEKTFLEIIYQYYL